MKNNKKKKEGKKSPLKKNNHLVYSPELDGKQKKIYAALQLLVNQVN